jgi:hypothetical protein
MRSSDSLGETDKTVRLVIALVAAGVIAVGYLVLQPFSIGAGVPWLIASLAPPTIYYVGTRGLAASLVFGALLLGITILGWGSVAAADKEDLVGVYPITVFVLTLITSLIGAAVGSVTAMRSR